MKSLLSQFTFLDCLRLSVKRLEFSPFSPSPHPSNLGTEAQASTALAHGQAEALKKNKKTRENVCRDLKREETFCDSLDFTCNWKTTWGSFMTCSAGCWDLYRSWWFSSRQGWVCLHILYTVYNRISTVYLCKRYNTYFGHMFARFDSPHCDHCKFFQGMAAAARSVFFVMCLLVRHQKHHHLGNRGFRLSRTRGFRSWFYMFFPLPSRSWLRAQWWEAFISLQPGSSEWVSFGHVFCDLPFPAFEVQHSMYTLLIYGTFLDDIAPFCDEVGRNM